MGSTWTPPSYMFFDGDNRLRWQERFVWWPKRSDQSKQRLWMTKAWYGYRYVYGPAGESPVKIEQWLTNEEYMWYKLTEQ